MNDTITPVPGKFYKLRNGMKYRCYANDNLNGWEVHGAFYHGGTWKIIQHMKDGQYFKGSFGHELNIISEWNEYSEFKKGDKVMALDESGKAFRRYFSHVSKGRPYCFYGGQTEWSSDDAPCVWASIRPTEEELR